MPGWIHLKVELLKDGMAKYRIRNPIFKPSPIKPAYSDYLIFEGISVDEQGEQHYLDVNVADRQACLNAIAYLTKFGYAPAQAYAILGAAPVQGHISGGGVGRLSPLPPLPARCTAGREPPCGRDRSRLPIDRDEFGERRRLLGD